MVDTLGLPVMITMTAGDVRDEIIARDLLWRLRLTHPQITQVWAFSAYARDLLPAWTADHLWLSLQPVLRPRGTRGFVVLVTAADSWRTAAGISQVTRVWSNVVGEFGRR